MSASFLVHFSTPLEFRLGQYRVNREWRARCGCGWMGAWWTTQGKAIAEQARHENWC